MKGEGDSEFFEELCQGGAAQRLLLVAAHPDDEVIAAGGHLSRWGGVQVLHVTDGAPRNMQDALAAGFAKRHAYVAARRRELEAAMALAGIGRKQLHALDFPDQEASFRLPELVPLLLEAVQELQPQAILTHPYEGGHPDHDATAFAVQTVCDLLGQRRRTPPRRIEAPFYHNRDGSMDTGRFLPGTGPGVRPSPGAAIPESHSVPGSSRAQASSRPAAPGDGRTPNGVCAIPLTEPQRELKRRLFQCFRTQQQVLSVFSVDWESFRFAPRYDFTRAPHEGRLYYELFDWQMTGPRWRHLARKALAGFGLPGGAGPVGFELQPAIAKCA